MVEHYDFVKVSEEAWAYLYAWYGADCSIFRFVTNSEKVDTTLGTRETSVTAIGRPKRQSSQQPTAFLV